MCILKEVRTAGCRTGVNSGLSLEENKLNSLFQSTLICFCEMIFWSNISQQLIPNWCCMAEALSVLWIHKGWFFQFSKVLHMGRRWHGTINKQTKKTTSKNRSASCVQFHHSSIHPLSFVNNTMNTHTHVTLDNSNRVTANESLIEEFKGTREIKQIKHEAVALRRASVAMSNGNTFPSG